MISVPIALVGLVGLFWLTQAIADWPNESHEGAVLVGIGVLALLPLFLLLLGAIAGPGGSLEAFGVRIQFPEATTARQEIVIPPRLGLNPGRPLADSDTQGILQVLRDASRSEVAVIDIEDGEAWWETRLLVFCAGAERLARPAAVAFVATVAGVPQTFRGWAVPADIVRLLLARRPDLRAAHDRALAIHRQWELAVPPIGGGSENEPGGGTPPFALDPDTTRAQWTVFPGNGPRNEFAQEQLIAAEVGKLEAQRTHGLVSSARLIDLFEPVLRTQRADLDQDYASRETVRLALSTTDQYVALVRSDRYAGLVGRDEIVNDVLLALLRQVEGSSEGSTAP